MGKNKQAIVPVKLQNNQNDRRMDTKPTPQQLIARLKCSQTEHIILEIKSEDNVMIFEDYTDYIS